MSPLNGEINFIHGIPYFALSIAEVVNGAVISSVIYNPASSDLYFAEKGNGAFKEGYRNHERLRVSARKDITQALICAPERLSSHVSGTRNLGSTSLDLANLASGKFDGVISLGNDASEIAAGILLVHEAGGKIMSCEQKDIRTSDYGLVLATGNIVAANAELGKKLFDIAK